MRATLLSLAFAALAAQVSGQTTAGGLSNVVSDISILSSGLRRVETDINAPGGNSVAYTPAQLDRVYDDNAKCIYYVGNTTAALGNSAKFNQADSAKLGSALISSLKPAVTNMVNALVAHKPGFQAASASAQASQILGYVSGDAMGLASSVIGKVSGPTATAEASSVSSSLAAVFASAKRAYP